MSTIKLLVLGACKVKSFVCISNNLKRTGSLVTLQIMKKIIYFLFVCFSVRKNDLLINCLFIYCHIIWINFQEISLYFNLQKIWTCKIQAVNSLKVTRCKLTLIHLCSSTLGATQKPNAGVFSQRGELCAYYSIILSREAVCYCALAYILD